MGQVEIMALFRESFTLVIMLFCSILAMTFAIAGLIATDHTTIARPGSAAISYPGFFDDLERVRA